jgi:hypothetical protein
MEWIEFQRSGLKSRPMAESTSLFLYGKKCSFFAMVCLLTLSSLWAFEIQLPSGVSVDLDGKKVSFPVIYVGEKSGLEFLVTKGMDKDYEALFSAGVTGRDLHMALKMIGLEPEQKSKTPPVEEASEKAKGQLSGNVTQERSSKRSASPQETVTKKGSPVILEIIYNHKTYPIRRFLQWSDGKTVEDLGLFFLGSRFIDDGGKRTYEADLRLNLVGAWHDDSSMVLGPSVQTGNLYDDDGPPYLVPHPKGPMPNRQKARMTIRFKP